MSFYHKDCTNDSITFDWQVAYITDSNEDLENAKITLRTGGGKGGEDEIEISATCCDPKEITIQRSLEYFTK